MIPQFTLEVMKLIAASHVETVSAWHITKRIAEAHGVKRHTNYNRTVSNVLMSLHERGWGLYIGSRGRFQLTAAGREALQKEAT